MLDHYQASVPEVIKTLKQYLLLNQQEILETVCELGYRVAAEIVAEAAAQEAHLRPHITIKVVAAVLARELHSPGPTTRISTLLRDATTLLAATVAAHISSALAIIADSTHHLRIVSYCLAISIYRDLYVRCYSMQCCGYS